MVISVVYFVLVLVSLAVVASLFLGFTTVKKVNKLTNSRNIQSIDTLNPIREELKNALNGLNFYRTESEKWHSAYVTEQKEHKTTKLEFAKEITQLNKELSTLKYIVEKMDGKEIYRDSNRNIVRIARVK